MWRRRHARGRPRMTGAPYDFLAPHLLRSSYAHARCGSDFSEALRSYHRYSTRVASPHDILCQAATSCPKIDNPGNRGCQSNRSTASSTSQSRPSPSPHAFDRRDRSVSARAHGTLVRASRGGLRQSASTGAPRLSRTGTSATTPQRRRFKERATCRGCVRYEEELRRLAHLRPCTSLRRGRLCQLVLYWRFASLNCAAYSR